MGLIGGAAALYRQAPEIAAGALLHPARRTGLPPTPANCVDKEYSAAGVTLRGWHCAAEGRRRGTIVYLHGVADNRGSGVGAIRRFTPRGYDVVAYDSRAHGKSDGDACTYGFYEKVDLQRVLDTVSPGPIVLVGTSLGAAVAIQAAAEDPRVSGVVAAEVFSDLQSIASYRAPAVMWPHMIVEALEVAEQRGQFDIYAVSPEVAARSVRVPVLVVHGEDDTETPDGHSVIVHAALAGPKKLVLVAGRGHNESLSDPAVWADIDDWIDKIMRGKS